jgi:hypothetical protein
LSLRLAHGLAFEDLYRRAGLVRLDGHFLAFLEAAEGALAARLRAGRAAPEALDAKTESQLLLDLAPYLERFLSQLFEITDEVRVLAGRHDELAPLYRVKRQFVQRRAGTRIKPAAAEALDGEASNASPRRSSAVVQTLTFAASTAARAGGNTPASSSSAPKSGLHTTAAGGTLSVSSSSRPCRSPHLVHADAQEREGVTDPAWPRRRNALAIDPGTDLAGRADQATHCIWCRAGRDSAPGLRQSPGLWNKDPHKMRSRRSSASRSPAARSTRS